MDVNKVNGKRYKWQLNQWILGDTPIFQKPFSSKNGCVPSRDQGTNDRQGAMIWVLTETYFVDRLVLCIPIIYNCLIICISDIFDMIIYYIPIICILMIFSTTVTSVPPSNSVSMKALTSPLKDSKRIRPSVSCSFLLSWTFVPVFRSTWCWHKTWRANDAQLRCMDV